MAEEKKQRFEIVEVPTQMGLAYQDNETKEVLDESQLLILIANELEEIKKALVSR